MKKLALIFGLLTYSTAPVFATQGYSWTVTDDFGPRLLSTAFDFHNGVDFSAASSNSDDGVIFESVEAGTITFIGSFGSSIWGASINGGANRTFSYLHIGTACPSAMTPRPT